jgi:hypothetical protein
LGGDLFTLSNLIIGESYFFNLHIKTVVSSLIRHNKIKNNTISIIAIILLLCCNLVQGNYAPPQDPHLFQGMLFLDSSSTSTKEEEILEINEPIFITDEISNNVLHLKNIKINNYALLESIDFQDTVSLYNIDFQETININNLYFHNYAIFYCLRFARVFSLVNSTFQDIVDFPICIFEGESNFFDVKFNGGISFIATKFLGPLRFENCIFKKNVDFSGTKFKNYTDLRRSNFFNVDTIFVSFDTEIPIGKFYIDWEQIKARKYLLIQTKPSSFQDTSNEFSYKMLQSFYYQLRDNYLAQGDKKSADAVMFELEMQKQKLSNNLWHDIYGIFMGWGYKPYRFILLIFIPIILFSFIWYWFYFQLIIKIVNPNIKEELFPLRTRKFNLPVSKSTFFVFKNIKLPINYYQHAKFPSKLNRFIKYWHALFFSASVLLSIKFKKEWLQINSESTVGQKSFLYFVIFEWVLGLFLYTLFFILIKSSGFDFIKSILGF